MRGLFPPISNVVFIYSWFLDRYPKIYSRSLATQLSSRKTPKSQQRKYFDATATSRAEAFPPRRAMVAKPLQLRTRTALPISLLLPVLRQIPPRTRHGRCKAQFAMSKAPVVISTRPVVLHKLAQNWPLQPPMTIVREAPAMAASRTLCKPKDSLSQCHTGLVPVLGPWELLASSSPFHALDANPPVGSLHSFEDIYQCITRLYILVIALGVFLDRSAFFRFNKVGWSLFSF